MLPLISTAQNVVVKGQTESYYSKKVIKDVKIKTFLGDSLIGEYYSKGSFKVPIKVLGIVKVLFVKEGYIDKFFLINTQEIPRYYLKKKLTLKADISIIQKDKYMVDNELENAVGYAYYNAKYRSFIWDPEYTRKAQIAMDVQVFPLEEVIQLDSAFNKKGKSYYFQNGINYYVNIKTEPENLFKENINYHSASRIKYPVIRGYLYAKYQYYLIEGHLDSANFVYKKLIPGVVDQNDLGAALKKCKHLDTLILDNKLSAIGFWINLINHASVTKIKDYSNIANQIKSIEKKMASIVMTDAELSFYTDLKKVAKLAVQLNQLIGSLNDHERSDPKNYEIALKNFKEQVRVLSKNCELTNLD